jgi:N-acyl-D-aspartate/D-glutamate deacylase
MSVAADRPLNWNVLTANSRHPARTWEMVQSADYAAERGGRVVPLTACEVIQIYISFKSGFFLASCPGWGGMITQSSPDKLASLANPAERARLRATGDSWRDWSTMTILRSPSPAHERYEGRLVGDVAHELGQPPLELVFDLVVGDRLDTILLAPLSEGMGEDEDTWDLRGQLWRDPRVLVGASDAGAHLDLITTFTFGTSVLRAARLHGLMELEDAVHLITDRPARLYGLRHRGRVAEGWFADLVVLDEETIAPGPIEWRDDLPAGGGRLFSEAIGIHRVFVNGREIVRENTLTGQLPGALLRSHRDTDTVTARMEG